MSLKTIYSLFVILFASSLLAQNFTVPETDTVFYGDISDDDFASKFIVDNDTTISFPMSWEVESENMASGWEFSICDPITCHPIGTTNASFTLPTSTANRIMNIHYYPNSNYGQSTVTVKLWQDQFPNDFVLLTWTGVVSALGLNEAKNYSVYSVFSAETNSIQFVYELPPLKLYHIDLYDISGRLITTTPINNGSGQVSLGENLSSGVYLYKVRSENSDILSNKVLVP